MKINQKLDLLCIRSNVTRAELERVVGHVSKSTINNWLSGRTKPDLGAALRVARYFHVSLEWLADDEAGFPPPPTELPDDEAFVLELYRLLGLTRFQAVRALTYAPFIKLQPGDDPNKRLIRYYDQRAHLAAEDDPVLAEQQIDIRLLSDEDKSRLAKQLTERERRDLGIREPASAPSSPTVKRSRAKNKGDQPPGRQDRQRVKRRGKGQDSSL